MKYKFIRAYMDTAERFAALSYAKRLQVGSIVVKDDRIISIGYNGMPSGWENVCEDKVYLNEFDHPFMSNSEVQELYPYEDEYGLYALKSKPEVLHAERNALDKLARGTESGQNAALFVTHAPCIECAKSIYGAGITEVYYKNDYKTTDGIDFLTKCGVKVSQV